MDTLTYLLGKSLYVFLVCKSKFKSSELDWKVYLFGLIVVLVSVVQCNFRKP